MKRRARLVAQCDQARPLLRLKPYKPSGKLAIVGDGLVAGTGQTAPGMDSAWTRAAGTDRIVPDTDPVWSQAADMARGLAGMDSAWTQAAGMDGIAPDTGLPPGQSP